jgi:hypothetical protein
MSEIRDHVGQVMAYDPNAIRPVGWHMPCQVCGEPASSHIEIVIHPYLPEGETVPDYGDGRIHDHVARVPERDPNEWFPPDVVGWCDECGQPAEMHDEVATVPLEDS